MATLDIITALTKTFIIILPGFILAKLGIIKPQHTEGMSSLITSVAYPCLVISAMQSVEFSWEILNNCKYVVLIFMCVIAVSMVLSKLLTKLVKMPSSQTGILAFMLVFGNTGFIGLPVMQGLFGPEAVFYGALCDSSYDIFMFTVGITLIRSAAAEESLGFKDTIKGIINPCFAGVLIGLVLYVSGIALPEIIGGAVKKIGSITSPLAMIIVGSHLARVNFKELVTSKSSYLVCLLKLIVSPAIALVFVKLIIGTGSLMASVVVMQAAMPVAMCAVIFSERYKADVDFATKGVLLTSIMCIVTIPLYAVLLQNI
ncbi:MAG: AEC family transporter [Firmicutes bacterium]|nr:AEC family transporter [Bacillota bacterium]